MPLNRVCCFFTIVFAVSLSGIALGQDTRGGVVLLTMADCCPALSWPEAEDALIAEMELMDLSVTVIPSQAKGDAAQRDESEQVASRLGAAAAVRLTKSKRDDRAGVDLWIVDRVTGKTTFRSIDVDRQYDSAATIDVAVRTVEALRASLLELRISGREAPKEPVSPEIAELVDNTPLESDRRLLGLGASAGLNLSPGGMGPRGALELTAVVHPIAGLDIELSLLVSPVGKEIRSEEARSSFDYVLIRGWAYYRFFEKSMVQPAVGACGGTLIAWAKGTTLDGDLLEKVSKTVVYVGGGLRLYVFPTKLYDLFIGGNAGVTLPEIKAVHGTDQAATFGRPFVEIILGAQLRFS